MIGHTRSHRRALLRVRPPARAHSLYNTSDEEEACLLLPERRRGGIKLEGDNNAVAVAAVVASSRVKGDKSRRILPAVPGGGRALSTVLEHTADQLVKSRGGTLHFARYSQPGCTSVGSVSPLQLQIHSHVSCLRR